VPVTVDVPVRIVVDPLALACRLDEIEEATSAGAGRALANAVAVIRHTRGGFVAHRTHEPVLSWSGPRASEVSTRTRLLCEAAIRRALAGAVDAAFARSGGAGADRGYPLAERLASAPWEIVDRTRMAGLAGLYRIRGYQDGDDQLVPVRTPPTGPTLRWRAFDIGDRSWIALAKAAIRDHYAGALPAQIGVIFQRSDGWHVIFAERAPSAEQLVGIAVHDFTTLQPVASADTTSGGSITVREIPFAVPANATFRFRYVGEGRTAEQRCTIFSNALAPGLRPLIEHQVRRIAVSGEVDAVVEHRLREIGTDWAGRMPARSCYAVLIVSGKHFIVPMDRDLPRDLDVELLAIVEPVSDARGEGTGGAGGDDAGAGGAGGDGAGAGGAAGAGKGARADGAGRGGAGPAAGGTDAGAGDRGPAGVAPAAAGGRPGGPLGDAADGRRLWPVSGVDGETLICAPFLAEPDAKDLVEDFGLPERMRAIARSLEIPECRYLGNFTINAALVVITRARGIGVASAGASTATEVTIRHDGRGNNGFLDIRPGQSPDFEYLRLLARVAVRIHDFGNAVINAYSDPRNAPLVRVAADGEPNVAAWQMRFLGDFIDAVRAGYAHLYAETCRVLLLQQLRSSHSGITGRTNQFDAVLTSFTKTLDILGETVVMLYTLRKAIRHSETVLVTGTVRQVLAARETIVSGDATVELAPPIDSVASRILEQVGEALIDKRDSKTVAVYKGRVWTAEELDAAIDARRALLNRVDPLFLQVEDLSSLYTRAQVEPGFLHTYLRDLLARMLLANTTMTKKASDPDDGAFFALAASEYLRHRAGRDARGLRFELHGIHALADELLRPHVRGDRLYIEGVNSAISRKADFDDFLAVLGAGGIIVLGLLCAPLGAVAVAAITGITGIALAAHDVLEADRKTELYRALEDPELFLRWQEVQLAQLMAGLSVAFSVFDVSGVGRAAHAIVGTARQALRVGERAGVGMAVRSVARGARRQIVRNMTEEVLANAVRQALTEAAILAALDELFTRIIKPMLESWLRQQAIEHGTFDEVNAALGHRTPTPADPAPVPSPTRRRAAGED
jgi:hypothetical protein